MMESQLDAAVAEIVSFVSVLQMGSFYSESLQQLLRKPRNPIVWFSGTPSIISTVTSEDLRDRDIKECREFVSRIREEAVGLIVEMLRYQDWCCDRRQTQERLS